MIAEKQTKSNIGVGVGFVIVLAGRGLAAQGTGYSPWLGLLGLLSCLGLIVLVILPDKYKNGEPPQSGPGGYAPPQPGVWPPPPASPPSEPTPPPPSLGDR